jgi:hypothetical protein
MTVEVFFVLNYSFDDYRRLFLVVSEAPIKEKVYFNKQKRFLCIRVIIFKHAKTTKLFTCNFFRKMQYKCMQLAGLLQTA